MQNTPHAQPARQISLWDGICLIVGIMVGAGIFESSPQVARNAPNETALVLLWIAGGLLSLLGAVTYAGLGRAIPQVGGDYAYLKQGFGERVGFWYAWTMLTVVRPGNLGAMAYVFAHYAQQIAPLGSSGLVFYAAGAIILLSLLNALGTRQGKGIQNWLTSTKVIGIGILVALALGMTAGPVDTATPAAPAQVSWIGALIFVLFAYGGWNEIAFVTAELKNPEKNLPRALVLGTLAVTVLYTVVNLGFLHALGFSGLQNADAVAHTIAATRLWGWGGVFVSVLIAVSALGAVHGMIFSGARIYYAMGQDHPLFSRLGEWSERGAPLWSIAAESSITVALMILFSQTRSGFESLVLYTTPLFWFFTGFVCIAAFRLPGVKAHIPGYPWVPLAFFLISVFLFVVSVQYAYENGSSEILWSIGLLLAGVVLERVEAWRRGPRIAVE